MRQLGKLLRRLVRHQEQQPTLIYGATVYRNRLGAYASGYQDDTRNERKGSYGK